MCSHRGPIRTGETYQSVVNLHSSYASVKDPSRLFNSSLEGNTRRAVDFHEDDEFDEKPSRHSFELPLVTPPNQTPTPGGYRLQQTGGRA